MSHGRVITSGFSPPWWLRNPHLQTFWPVLFRRQQPVPHRAERLELPDGDFVDLCWTGPEQGPLVIVLHGLQGSIRSPYAVGILRTLASRGIRGVLMHFRGCSGQPNRLARGYHSGETEDLRYLISTLRQREPQTPLAAIGYSLGGNVLLKYLGESGTETPLLTGVAVSVPMVLRTASDRLREGLSRVYDRYLLRALVAGAKNKAPLLRDAGLDIDAVLGCQSIREFDEHLAAARHGFSGASDYYARCGSRGFLAKIRRPTLILHAADDPFMRPEVVPDASELSESVTLELSPGGGHVGFVSGFGRYWLEDRIPEFVSPVLLSSRGASTGSA